VIADWLDLPSVPESQLDDGLRERLARPDAPAAAPPPWATTVSAVLWWHRAAPGAAAQLPASMRGLRQLPITVGALVRYLDSPVGPYSEVFAAPVLVRPGLVPAVTVPFIAVDSIPSLVGGRAGWMLPKSLVSATWPPSGPARLDGGSWSVEVGVERRGPGFPLIGVLPLVQPQPDGSRRRSSVRLRSWAQVSRVDVATSGPSLPSWLLAGRHPGLAISSGRMRISAPRASA
jgi:hypothetical protein